MERTVIGDNSRWIEKRPQSKCSPAFEERDPNWTDWCEESSRKAAWFRAKELDKIRGTYQVNKATFLDPNLNLEQPLDQVLMPKKEKEFVVYSAASMHIMSKVDFTHEDQETITVSNKPTTVITAYGTIRTTEQATVNAKDLGMFVTARLLKNSPAK